MIIVTSNKMKTTVIIFCIILYIISVIAFSNLDIIQIGDVAYQTEKINGISPGYNIKRLGVNSNEDIYVWHGDMPYVLYKGAENEVVVKGVKSRVIHGFAIDSRDNFFFCRRFEGVAALWKGAEDEQPLYGVYTVPVSMAIDINDKIYLGDSYFVAKVDLADSNDSPSNSTYLAGFEKGFIVPAAIDSKQNIYFRESYGFFFYQNINEGASSKRKIPEIGWEMALGAAVDSEDNVYVAAQDGLYFIRAGTKGVDIEKVPYFNNKKVTSIHVDWRKNDVLYIWVLDEGLYKLKPLGKF